VIIFNFVIFKLPLQNTCNSIMLWYSHCMDQFYTSTTDFIISTIFKDWNFNLFDNSSVFYTTYALVWWKPPPAEDDSKKIEICRSISGLYVKVYIFMLVHLLILPITQKCIQYSRVHTHLFTVRTGTAGQRWNTLRLMHFRRLRCVHSSLIINIYL